MTNEEFFDGMKEVQRKIGYDFENQNLLIQAFTRSSFSKENPNWQDNEVLEFYGDSALNNYTTRHLYEMHGSIKDNKQFHSAKDEGELSKIRAGIIKKENLAHCIEILGFEKFLLMGNGDIKNNAQESISVKEDLFEAIVGAVAVDSKWNFKSIADVCSSMLVMANFDDDYITLVEEWCVRNRARCSFDIPHFMGTGFVTPENYDINSQYPFPILSSNRFNSGLNIPKQTELQLTAISIRFADNSIKKFEGKAVSFNGAKMAAAKKAFGYLELLDMRSFVGEITLENSIQQLQELWQNQNEYIDEPVYRFEEYHDENGNPIWKCVCKVYENISEAQASGKKDAKRLAAFDMLKKILDYDSSEDSCANYDEYDLEDEYDA